MARPAKERPQLLTVPEVAKLLRLSEWTVYALVKRNKIPGVLRFGKTIRFDRDALIAQGSNGAGSAA